MRKLLAVTLILISISACSISNNVTKIPLPSEPVQRPTEQELECVSSETYEVIVKAYKRIETLESIILSTH